MTLFQRWILLGFPDPASEVEATGAPAHRPFSRCLQRRLQVMVGLARPSVLEKVDEVLRGHRREAAVRVSGRAGVARVLWEGQGVTAHAGREDSSEVTRHSLKCTWTPLHSYVDSKRELGTRGCSAGRVSVPVHGAQSALSQGARRSPHFPPPHPHPALVILPPPPAVDQDPLWNCPGHHPPMFTQGPSTTSHSRHTQGSLVSAERTASGPGGELGQCLEMGLLPPAKPTPLVYRQLMGPRWWPSRKASHTSAEAAASLAQPQTGDAHRRRQRGGTSSNKARRQSWRWRRRRAVKGGKKGKQG